MTLRIYDGSEKLADVRSVGGQFCHVGKNSARRRPVTRRADEMPSRRRIRMARAARQRLRCRSKQDGGARDGYETLTAWRSLRCTAANEMRGCAGFSRAEFAGSRSSMHRQLHHRDASLAEPLGLRAVAYAGLLGGQGDVLLEQSGRGSHRAAARRDRCGGSS